MKLSVLFMFLFSILLLNTPMAFAGSAPSPSNNSSSLLAAPQTAKQKGSFWERFKEKSSLLKFLKKKMAKPLGDDELLIQLLLWFFLGSFGAHNFYAGKTMAGLGQLGLSLGMSAMYVGYVVTIFIAASGSATTFPVLAIVFIALAVLLALALSVWLIFDLIKIIQGNL